jgi:uncharacterized protein
MRMFFATDLHGSTLCFRKFCAALEFYDCDVLVLGGDLTGKLLVPIQSSPDGGKYVLGGIERRFPADRFADELHRIENIGYYPIPVDDVTLTFSSDDYERVLVQEAVKRAEQWIDHATRVLSALRSPIIVAPGNDDHPDIDEVFRSSPLFALAENVILWVGDHEIITTGFSTPTPWMTHREMSEDALDSYLRPTLSRLNQPSRSLFNIHVPPLGTPLDMCPDLDDELRIKMVAGNPTIGHHGSAAVRSLIEEYQPLASLHGHIHESRGFTRLGRTLALNPGSEYSDGILLGVVLDIDSKGRLRHSFTAG